jgi:hypothetical protein
MTLVCLLIAWSLSIGTFVTILASCTKGWRYVGKLHSVPCSKCQYFTDSRYLKCTVHPELACSEDAISCRDFVPQPVITRQKRSRNKAFVHTI